MNYIWSAMFLLGGSSLAFIAYEPNYLRIVLGMIGIILFCLLFPKQCTVLLCVNVYSLHKYSDIIVSNSAMILAKLRWFPISTLINFLGWAWIFSHQKVNHRYHMFKAAPIFFHFSCGYIFGISFQFGWCTFNFLHVY